MKKKTENIIKLISNLKNFRITGILITYEGSGDEGYIENICYTKNNCQTLDDVKEHINDPWDSDNHLIDVDKETRDLAEEWADEILDNVENWYNDDGGYGTIILLVNEGKHVINNNVKYTEVDSYTHNGNITDNL
jgi:hypothetical protein